MDTIEYESPAWREDLAAPANLISHLLSVVPYEHVDTGKRVKLPPRQQREYVRPPKGTERLVPERYVVRSASAAGPERDEDDEDR